MRGNPGSPHVLGLPVDEQIANKDIDGNQIESSTVRYSPVFKNLLTVFSYLNHSSQIRLISDRISGS